MTAHTEIRFHLDPWGLFPHFRPGPLLDPLGSEQATEWWLTCWPGSPHPKKHSPKSSISRNSVYYYYLHPLQLLQISSVVLCFPRQNSSNGDLHCFPASAVFLGHLSSLTFLTRKFGVGQIRTVMTSYIYVKKWEVLEHNIAYNHVTVLKSQEEKVHRKTLKNQAVFITPNNCCYGIYFFILPEWW